MVELIKNKEFTMYWEINKNLISICDECEYRYMCVDSRIPSYSKKIDKYIFNEKCNYDPYSCEWKIK